MKRRWLFVSLVVLVALGAFGVSLYRAYTDPGSAFQTPRPILRAAQTPTPKPTLSPEEALGEIADHDFMADRVNILLLGFDQSPERDDESSDVFRGSKNGFRSDVMMLLAVNFEAGTAHLISVPRDTYAQIYNTKGRYKINAAFAKGGGAEEDGFAYAQKTIELLFGVPVEYYAGVNMEGLKNIVDAIGGVNYDVDVEIHLNGRTLYTGYQHLTGQQVLDYCRARKGISTDVGRTDRQQRMLLTVFRQLQSQKKLATIPKLFTAVEGDLYTNLTLEQVAALASFGLSLNPETIKRTTLEGEYVANVYNASYYVLKNKSLEALVQEEFGVTVDRSSKYDLSKVKRDKAAAEAKRRAEAAKKAEEELTIPADTVRRVETEHVAKVQNAVRELKLFALALGAEAGRAERVQAALMLSGRAQDCADTLFERSLALDRALRALMQAAGS